MVKISGIARLGEFFLLADHGCSDVLLLEYPSDVTKPPVKFRLVKDEGYFKLQKALEFDHPHVGTNGPIPEGGFLVAEPFRQSSAKVTLVGKIDARKKGGFDGGAADTPARFVIRQVIRAERLASNAPVEELK